METIPVDDADTSDDAELIRHELSDSLGTDHIAINHYRLAPGKGLPGGLHTHTDQEELFVIIEGDATFETYPPLGAETPAGDEIIVAEGEAVRFAPGEFQSGRNESADELVLLAVGAPRDTEDVRFPLNCPGCDHGELRFEIPDDGPLFVCPVCGSEHLPDPCPDCDDDDLRVTLDGDGQPIVACNDCGAEFDTAPTTRLSDGTE